MQTPIWRGRGRRLADIWRFDVAIIFIIARNPDITSLQPYTKRSQNGSSSDVIWFRYHERQLNSRDCVNQILQGAARAAVRAITPVEAADPSSASGLTFAQGAGTETPISPYGKMDRIVRTAGRGDDLGHSFADATGVLPVGTSTASHDPTIKLRPAGHRRGRP